MSDSREHILKTIRQSLKDHALDMPFPEAEKVKEVFVKDDVSMEEVFAKEFTSLGGKFIYCSDLNDFSIQLQILADTLNWNNISTKDTFILDFFKDKKINFVQDAGDMKTIQVGLSYCECLVARTGSVILSSAQESGRSLPVYAPIHITLAFTKDVVWNISDAIDKLKVKYNHQLPTMLSLTTGPSRTADIEKTLVVGVHGPKEVYVFLVES